MVSKFDHALLHLLYQIRVGWLRAEVAAIVSNHEDARRIADHEGIRFVHLPVTPETKPAAGGGAPRARRRDRRRDGHPRPLHAGPVRRPLAQALRPRDQHPPLVPAGLQGREPLQAGLPARREADRRHQPLRHQRPRRGPDHRAGRRPRQPRRHAPTTSSPSAATSSPACSPARSSSTSSAASCSAAAGRSSSGSSRARHGVRLRRASSPANFFDDDRNNRLPVANVLWRGGSAIYDRANRAACNTDLSCHRARHRGHSPAAPPPAINRETFHGKTETAIRPRPRRVLAGGRRRRRLRDLGHARAGQPRRRRRRRARNDHRRLRLDLRGLDRDLPGLRGLSRDQPLRRDQARPRRRRAGIHAPSPGSA